MNTEATPKRELTIRALEAHAEHMRRLAAHYMKALEEVILSRHINAASGVAARALASNPESPEQTQPFAWYWFDHLGCLYMTGDDRKPDVPAEAKPLFEHPAPPPPSSHVACPCTLIEQDEDCPVGYPSMLCGVCKGTGNTTSEQVTALACEMIKIAGDTGGPEDPFAAWESIDLIKSQHGKLRRILKLAIDHIEHMAAHFSNLGTGYSFESLGEDMPGLKAVLATTEGSTP